MMEDQSTKEDANWGTQQYHLLIDQMSKLRGQSGSSESYDEREMSTWLTEAFKELTEIQRKVLLLHYHENLTYAETGYVVRKTWDEVFQAHEQALETLRNVLHRKEN